MFTLKGYIAYFETLCRQHVDIKHTDRNPRFFRMKPRDVTTKLGKADNVIVVIETPEFNFDDNKSDNVMKDKTGAFAILKRVPLDDFEKQDDAVDLCESIADEFVRILKRDNRNYDDLKFGYLPLNSISGFKVGPVYDGFYGVRIEFKFGDSISMCVNDSKWDFNNCN